MRKTVLPLLLTAVLLLMAACGETADSPAERSDQTEPIIEGADQVGQPELVLRFSGDAEPDISTMPLGIFLTVTDYQDGILTAVISNQSGHTMTYGGDYRLQKKANGAWEDVEPLSDFGWPDMAYLIEDLDEAAMSYDLSVYGNLDAGEYKLIASELEAEFELEYTGD